MSAVAHPLRTGQSGRSVRAMQAQGVDVGALLRKVAPVWLAWVLLAAPAMWLVAAYLAVSDAQFPSDVQVYDESGNLVSSGGSGAAITGLPRLFLGMLLGLGNTTLSSELPPLGWFGAAGVALLWAGQRRRVRLLPVTIVGALLALHLAVSGFWIVLAREPMRESLSQLLSQNDLTGFTGSFVGWGIVGLFGAILCWVFLRIGFGPVPLLPPPVIGLDTAGEVAPDPGTEAAPDPEPAPPVPAAEPVEFTRSSEVHDGDPLAAYRRPSES